MRVAAYCRVSTDRDDQANSFEAQKRYFRDCIERNPDWELQEVYADEGLSGTTTKKRVRFNAMIRAAQEGKIDLIITKEVSRFARNTLDTLEYTRMLQRLGIGVIFLIDNINTLDADGELRLTIMASLAQEESRKTSHRVKWGQTQSMEKGVVFGRSLLGYDVVNGRISINLEGAKTVRYIFHKYLVERKGTGIIAKELQEEGIVSGRGNVKWSASTVLKILKNEKYCGDLIQKKTCTPSFLTHEKKYNKGLEPLIMLRDHHEPIIDRPTWDAVQQELHRRNRNSASQSRGNRYPFSGKIKCAHCGSSFLSRIRKNSAGEPYRIWRCGTATLEGRYRISAQGIPMGCDIGRQIREDVAMDLLRRCVQDVEIDSEKIISALCCIVTDVSKDSRDAISTKKYRLERELEAERAKKQQVLASFFDQDISKEDFLFMNKRCDNRIAKLLEQITALENQPLPKNQTNLRDVIGEIVNGKRTTDDFYGPLLHHMTIFADGRVEVTLNFLPAQWIYTF